MLALLPLTQATTEAHRISSTRRERLQDLKNSSLFALSHSETLSSRGKEGGIEISFGSVPGVGGVDAVFPLAESF